MPTPISLLTLGALVAAGLLAATTPAVAQAGPPGFGLNQASTCGDKVDVAATPLDLLGPRIVAACTSVARPE
ncbi:hypothetical protein [Nonomuraea sp. NPDC046570]|uniref:hypothetical protein n=1 Tax=Nonomuraea sp. NPDC046570 TaxID=3155255 RepID=UPI0033D1C6A2